MGWAKFSDDTHANEHILPLSHAAFRLWTTAIMDNRGYKDGRSPFLSTARARALCRQQRVPQGFIKELEASGRWEPRDDGWDIHDFTEYLPSRREEAGEREKDPIKVAAGKASAAKRQQTVNTPPTEREQPGNRLATPRAPVRVDPVPVPVPVGDLSETRGDVGSGEANGAMPAGPSPQVQVLRLLDWLLAKRGWSSWSSRDSQKHEAQQAIHIVELGLPREQLYAKLEAWWTETDPDDRPSSLEYFWTRLQDEQHQGLKQQARSHVRTDGLTKVEPVAPKRGKP